MTNTVLETHVFYEIAMSIGNANDMQTMLKESMKAYVQKLGFLAGAVFRTVFDDDGYCRFEYIYSIPRSLFNNKDYLLALDIISGRFSTSESIELLGRTPIVQNIDEERIIVVYKLENFGLLCFIAAHERLSSHLIRSLLPINAKLAQACLACQNSDALKAEIIVRQDSERFLAESEKQLRAILDSVQTGILIVDMHSKTVVEVNTQALKLTGREKSEIVGLNCSAIICTPENGICPVNRKNPIMENHECVLYRADGKNVPILKNARIIELKGTSYILESFVDLTSMKTAAEEKRRLENMLKQSQKMEAIGTLAGGIAHDFNNLLTPIMGMVQLSLEEEDLSSEIRENLEAVSQASIRARDLVKQILAFAHQTEDAAIPISPATIVKETLKLMRASLSPAIEISSRLVSKSIVMGVPTHIQQIVMNLFSNAAHAMKDKGGMLTVELLDVLLEQSFLIPYPGRVPGYYLKLTVQDTGCGIPSDIVDYIFQPYFTTKSSEEGTGLGLALVHGLVNACGGFVDFTTELGKGTKFDVYFPIVKSSKSDSPQRISISPGGKGSVLVVDDEPCVLNFMEKMLSRLGYGITACVNPLEALSIFSKSPRDFHLVITDIMMPHMTGDRLIGEILKIEPNIPILVLTGYTDKETISRLQNLGVRKILLKPMSSSDIAKSVAEILNNHEVAISKSP